MGHIWGNSLYREESTEQCKSSLAQNRLKWLTSVLATIFLLAHGICALTLQTPDYQMAWQIKSTNTSQRGSGNNHFGGHGGGWFNSGGQGGHGRGCGHSPSTNSNTQPKPNASGFYLDWNKLSFEECDKIHKEHKEKLDQSGTNKRNLGDISMDMLPPSPG